MSVPSLSESYACRFGAGAWRYFVRVGARYEILRPIQAPIRTLSIICHLPFELTTIFHSFCFQKLAVRAVRFLIDQEQT
jgi:hypothetical protein